MFRTQTIISQTITRFHLLIAFVALILPQVAIAVWISQLNPHPEWITYTPIMFLLFLMSSFGLFGAAIYLAGIVALVAGLIKFHDRCADSGQPFKFCVAMFSAGVVLSASILFARKWIDGLAALNAIGGS